MYQSMESAVICGGALGTQGGLWPKEKVPWGSEPLGKPQVFKTY